ncbi:3-dehydroquinate dehydratase, type I [Beijerinckia indica subsp. indica ATCC 9039]|uniref:3-dehydroquinate dehydratase n=1 Tax=Beijerinckia indica subsp. indica (strain ATCC 9039 / DSM 1715 / NCIMB 8712) TaxID=395963 RepID=B2IG06_BEII9|nr:3-dehydroquinate dehydratase, type I [Beijerinckia indica subsp. indica ATCC 9039]
MLSNVAGLLEWKAEMRVVSVKDVVIGAGRPKIIVPITAKTFKDALTSATRLSEEKTLDLIELRVDYLENALDARGVAGLLREAAKIQNAKPMIVTFRTKAEGGMTALDGSSYVDFYKTILQEGRPDLIDVEVMRGDEIVREVIDAAHGVGVGVILSNHDFNGTAPAEELVARMRSMQDLGADIVKIATMPKDAGDVLQLLNATWLMHSRYAECPLITMAMAGQGVVSRLSGEVFGSAATFGMVGEASAPGQVQLHELRPVLDLIHAALGR